MNHKIHKKLEKLFYKKIKIMKQDIIDPQKTEFLKTVYSNIVFVNFVLFACHGGVQRSRMVKTILIEEFS